MLDEEDEKLLSAKPRRRRGAGPEEEEEAGKPEGGDSTRGRPTSREQRDSDRPRDAKSPRQEEENAQTGRAAQTRRHRSSTSKVVPVIAEVDNNEAAYFEEADTNVEGRRRRGQKPGRTRRSSEGARAGQNEEEDLGTDYI
jgi:hypothetical protein